MWGSGFCRADGVGWAEPNMNQRVASICAVQPCSRKSDSSSSGSGKGGREQIWSSHAVSTAKSTGAPTACSMRVRVATSEDRFDVIGIWMPTGA